MPGEEAVDWRNSEEASRPVREYLAALEETNGPAFFAYSTNYLIDLEAGIIVDVEASAVNRTAEVEQPRP